MSKRIWSHSRGSSGARWLFALALIATTVQAAEPIELQADQAQMSQTTGIGVYTGNVVLTQGDVTIQGDRMTVHTRAGRTLEQVIVEGTPARFEQRRDAEPPIQGQAPRMEYHASTEHVLLLGGATLVQGRNEFSGEHIRYELAGERVFAEGEGERRTRITFFPENDETESEP